jgi:AbrB family looped-hinge helix DNA binding protein
MARNLGSLRNPRTRVLSSLYGGLEQGFHPCYCKDGLRPDKTMAKVTSKYQVTVPKVIAQRYDISPGDNIDWVAAGDVIRVIPSAKRTAPQNRESRLRLFDQATERHRRRPVRRKAKPPTDRGWTRADLYERGRSR